MVREQVLQQKTWERIGQIPPSQEMGCFICISIDPIELQLIKINKKWTNISNKTSKPPRHDCISVVHCLYAASGVTF